MLSLKARWLLVGASVSLFLVACATPALELVGNAHTYTFGAEALIEGPLAGFLGQFAWFANLLLLPALLLALTGRLRACAVCAFVGLAIANQTWTLVGSQIPGDEGGVTHYTVKSLQIGFYLWLASFAVLGVGGLLFRSRLSIHRAFSERGAKDPA
jgi:hypothetical protein